MRKTILALVLCGLSVASGANARAPRLEVFAPTLATGPIRAIGQQYVAACGEGDAAGAELVVHGRAADGTAHTARCRLPRSFAREGSARRVSCWHVYHDARSIGSRFRCRTGGVEWRFDTRAQVFRVTLAGGAPAAAYDLPAAPSWRGLTCATPLPLERYSAAVAARLIQARGGVLARPGERADVLVLPTWVDVRALARGVRPAELSRRLRRGVRLVYEHDLAPRPALISGRRGARLAAR